MRKCNFLQPPFLSPGVSASLLEMALQLSSLINTLFSYPGVDLLASGASLARCSLFCHSQDTGSSFFFPNEKIVSSLDFRLKKCQWLGVPKDSSLCLWSKRKMTSPLRRISCPQRRGTQARTQHPRRCQGSQVWLSQRSTPTLTTSRISHGSTLLPG